MIPFVALGAQCRMIQPPVEDAAPQVLRSGQHILGPVIEALETEIASFAGVTHWAACATGTDALAIAPMAKDVGIDDATFANSFTFMASAEAIALVGATPAFVDLNERTADIDPARLWNWRGRRGNRYPAGNPNSTSFA